MSLVAGKETYSSEACLGNLIHCGLKNSCGFEIESNSIVWEGRSSESN